MSGEMRSRWGGLLWLRHQGWALLLIGSLGLHALVCLAYAGRWDRAALLTIVPYPLWCLAGIGLAGLSWLWRRTRPALWVLALWLLTFTRSDELRAWKNLGIAAPIPGGPAGDASGRRAYRLVTFNTHLFNPAAAREVLAWKPDVVLLQEAPPLPDLNALARELYGADALVVARPDCAILARGRAMQLFDFQWPVALPGGTPWAVCARWVPPDGRPIDILNLHLLKAETDPRLWTRTAWRAHAENRRNRRFQLDLLLASHRTATARLPRVPLIVAGDFNAPAGDAALAALPASGLRDSYLLAGGRPGNTYPNAFPLHRIDQCWLSPDLIPMRHGVPRAARSDHRMVVVDFIRP